MDTHSFVININTEDFYIDIAYDIKKWFDVSKYSEDDKIPLPRGMSK